MAIADARREICSRVSSGPLGNTRFETRLIRELLIAHIAAQLRAYDTDRGNLAGDVFQFCDGDDGRFEKAFGGRREFLVEIAKYLLVGMDKWPDVLIENLKIKEIPVYLFR